MFDYIYSDSKRKGTFFRIPMILFTDPQFASLTSEMKLLYALMLDRTSLSAKNHWYDADHKVYISFPVAEIMQKLGVANQKAARLLKGLENMGLIERVKVGLGKPDRIYVKDCQKQDSAEMADLEDSVDVTAESTVENEAAPVSEPDENQPSEDADPPAEDVNLHTLNHDKSHGYTYNNQTNRTRLNQSDPIDPSARTTDGMDHRKQYEKLIKANIDYDWFVSVFTLPVTDRQRPKGNQEELDELVGIMLDCICSNAKTIRVNGQDMDANVVKAQLLKLDSEHIQFVFDRMYANTSEVTNVRAYLITTLYNASLTMNTAFGMDFRATFGNGGATV